MLPVQENAFDRLDFLLERLQGCLEHLLVGFLSLLLFVDLIPHPDELPVYGFRCFGELINLITLFAAKE